MAVFVTPFAEKPSKTTGTVVVKKSCLPTKMASLTTSNKSAMPGPDSPNEKKDNATGDSEPEEKEDDIDSMPELRSGSDSSSSSQQGSDREFSDDGYSPRFRELLFGSQQGSASELSDDGYSPRFRALQMGRPMIRIPDPVGHSDSEVDERISDDESLPPLGELHLYPIGHTHSSVDRIHL
jgi:hypothetical protein